MIIFKFRNFGVLQYIYIRKLKIIANYQYVKSYLEYLITKCFDSNFSMYCKIVVIVNFNFNKCYGTFKNF
jgi:hypothetical protein